MTPKLRSFCSAGALLVACASPGAATPATTPRGPTKTTPSEASNTGTAFDPSGRATACEAPQQDCPVLPRAADFLERCRLAGFQTLRCGCQELCAGKVPALRTCYASDGSAKD